MRLLCEVAEADQDWRQMQHVPFHFPSLMDAQLVPERRQICLHPPVVAVP